jgi:hypothetical protein
MRLLNHEKYKILEIINNLKDGLGCNSKISK